eukprot:113498_1
MFTILFTIFYACWLQICNTHIITQQEINSFMASIDGDVYNASTVEYHNITHSIDNTRNIFYPKLIVVPLNDNDIKKTINFTKTYKLPFSILGGGHNAVGWCFNNNGIVLNMQPYYTNISIIEFKHNNGSIIPAISLGAGIRWIDVYLYINQSTEFDGTYNNYNPVGGTCAGVGVMGFTLGGGISMISRSYGLSIDNILSLTVITADTHKHTLRKDTISNNKTLQRLWWALLGGGGNNFGIVTNIVTRIHQPISTDNKILYSSLMYTVYNDIHNINHAVNVTNWIKFYNIWQADLPEFIAVYALFRWDNSLYNDSKSLMFGFQSWCNEELSVCMAILSPLMQYADDNFVSEYYIVNYDHDTLLNWVAKPGLTDLRGSKAYIRNGYIPEKGINGNVITIFMDAMLNVPDINLNSFILWSHLGGKITDKSSDETSYFWRSSNYLFEVKAVYTDLDVETDIFEWTDNLLDALEPYLKGKYVNYQEEFLEDAQMKYYGDNYYELQCIKYEWDPNSFFNSSQSIGTSRCHQNTELNVLLISIVVVCIGLFLFITAVVLWKMCWKKCNKQKAQQNEMDILLS